MVGSFFASDNTCEICRAGYQPSCLHREAFGPTGAAQAERMRVPLADGTLVATPEVPDDDLVPHFLAASDVLGTGWFAAVAAEAGPGKTVAVVGDGAVGLLGVLAAQQLGAERIIAMSRHEPRQQLALEFGATDIVTERGDDGVAAIKDLTDGLGAHSVIEAVGTQESMMQAIHSTRPGGHVGYVGVTHDVALAGHGAVLLPRPPARRPRPGPPVPARPDGPDLGPADPTRARCSTSSCRSTRPPTATGRWTNAAGHQGPAPPLTRLPRCRRATNRSRTMTGPDIENGSFAGKVAFVTGAGSGIGRTTALAFAREGASVVVADIAEQGNQETARMIEELGGRALAVRCDVTRSEDVQAALDQTVDAFGRLDVAFNNAGAEQKPSADRRRHRGGVGPDHRHQPPQRVPVHEVRDPADARARRRRDREHLLRRRRQGLRTRRRLRRRQARRHRPDQGRRTRLRRVRTSASTPSAPASSTPR